MTSQARSHSSADTPGVIAARPLVFGLVFLAGVALDAASQLSLDLPRARLLPAGGLLLAAAAFLVPALGAFRRAGTRPEPWRPSTAVVTTGIYARTRSLMYLGLGLAYAGLALLANSLAALALLPVAMLVISHGVIAREEEYLERKFGAPYRAYNARVRRWL